MSVPPFPSTSSKSVFMSGEEFDATLGRIRAEVPASRVPLAQRTLSSGAPTSHPVSAPLSDEDTRRKIAADMALEQNIVELMNPRDF